MPITLILVTNCTFSLVKHYKLRENNALYTSISNEKTLYDCCGDDAPCIDQYGSLCPIR